MSRTKINQPVPQTREEMCLLVNEIADLEIEIAEVVARREKYLQSVHEDWNPKVEALVNRAKNKVALAHVYADAHPEAFEGKKSIDFPRGTIGFRTGNPAVKTLRGFTWERVLGALRTLTGSKFIRTVEEIDKEKLIAARDSFKGEELKNLGIKFEQKETFYVDTEVEKPEAVTREAA